jgi:hypothetical protein
MESRIDNVKRFVSQHHYLSVLVFVVLVKALFWAWSFAVCHWVPLAPKDYFSGGHHLNIDPRITEGRIDPLTIWIYADAEWYLSIAEHGYPGIDGMKKAAEDRAARRGYPYNFVPGDPNAEYCRYTEWDADMKYAFFPLYPMSIALFHLAFPLHAAAFLVTQLISASAFVALYALVLTYFGDKALAFRSLVLLVVFPFSVFYQAYFSEGLFLLLSVLSFYLLKRGRMDLSILCGSLLMLARPTGAAIAIPLAILAAKRSAPAQTRADKRAEKLGRRRRSGLSAIDWRRGVTPFLTLLGLLPLFAYDYFKTGHWNGFALAQRRWGYASQDFLRNILENIFVTGSRFFSLKLFGEHHCQVDYVVMILSLLLLALSYRKLPLELWSFAFLLWLIPVGVKDLMSFSRYISVAFPLFLYLAGIRRRYAFWALAALFLAGSLYIDGRMVTWHWVG